MSVLQLKDVLVKREILDILIGDTSVGEFKPSMELRMPYLTGSDICGGEEKR